jgi:hypothetical protein
MPILIDELIVEAEPPRSPQAPQQSGGAPSGEAPQAKPGQGDRMLELSIVADRHYRLQVD